MPLGPTEMFVLDQASNQASNRRQQRYNQKAFERTKQFYWNQWNANNEYNHPVQQRARLEEAGFNPALMYGQSSSTGMSTMGSTANMEPAQLKELPGGLEFAQLQLIKSQQLNTDEDTQLKTVDGALKIQQTATEKLKPQNPKTPRAQCKNKYVDHKGRIGEGLR